MAKLPEQRPLVEQRSGHLEIIGETAAKLIFFQQGWNPYSRFLDVDKVDFILRRNRSNAPEYREIQVKYRRLYKESPSQWSGKHFDATAWYPSKVNDFASHRPGFFIMFIFGYPDRQLERDVLIFPSEVFHQLLQRAPSQGKGKVLYISKMCADDRWQVWLKRTKFDKIDKTTCVDVTKYRNNFALLD